MLSFNVCVLCLCGGGGGGGGLTMHCVFAHLLILLFYCIRVSLSLEGYLSTVPVVLNVSLFPGTFR